MQEHPAEIFLSLFWLQISLPGYLTQADNDRTNMVISLTPDIYSIADISKHICKFTV